MRSADASGNVVWGVFSAALAISDVVRGNWFGVAVYSAFAAYNVAEFWRKYRA